MPLRLRAAIEENLSMANGRRPANHNLSRDRCALPLFSSLIYTDSFFNFTLVLLQVFYKVATHKLTAPFSHFSGCDLNLLVLSGPCFEI